MPLFEPKPGALRPRTGSGRPPAADRVPDDTGRGHPQPLRGDLDRLLGADKVLGEDLRPGALRLRREPLPLRAAGRGARRGRRRTSRPCWRYARGNGRNVVFRAAGTSLNGQAQGEDILVDVRRHWAASRCWTAGARARIRPGTTVLPGQRRPGPARPACSAPTRPAPSPAPSAGCVANNASGMTAGTTRNSYRTVASLTVVLPSGTVVDTADPTADERAGARPNRTLCQGLLDLKAEIEADPELVARIRAKYEIKNTNGYRLDAFLDADTPSRSCAA